MNNYTLKITNAYKLVIDTLHEMGYNTKEDKNNMKESAKRSAKGFLEIIKPMPHIKREINKILKKSFNTRYKGMIFSQNIIVFSFCPHHFLPVAYRITVAYLPNEKGKVLGISKLARICQLLASRPVLQETLTTDIADIFSNNNCDNPFFEGIESNGSGVSIEGLHMCMAIRGIKQHSSRMITTELRGAFYESLVKSEFMSIVTSNRPENII